MSKNPRARKGVVIVGAVALVLIAFAAYAARINANTKAPPDLTLVAAYEKAIESLGAETNAFYCLLVNALSISDSSGPTEWHLEFYSTNGQFREVVIPSKGKVIVRTERRTSF